MDIQPLLLTTWFLSSQGCLTSCQVLKGIPSEYLPNTDKELPFADDRSNGVLSSSPDATLSFDIAASTSPAMTSSAVKLPSSRNIRSLLDLPFSLHEVLLRTRRGTRAQADLKRKSYEEHLKTLQARRKEHEQYIRRRNQFIIMSKFEDTWQKITRRMNSSMALLWMESEPKVISSSSKIEMNIVIMTCVCMIGLVGRS